MYADSLTLAQARKEFFAKTGFSESEYSSTIAKVKLGIVPIYFYNFKDRRSALAVHDVHHILTGYDTSLLGEAQVSAWEIGSTSRKDLNWAYVYVALGFITGLVLDRDKTIKAYEKGLRCRNFYGKKLSPKMLSQTLGELRCKLGL